MNDRVLREHTPGGPAVHVDRVATEVVELYAPFRERTAILGNYTPTKRPGVNRNQREALDSILARLHDADTYGKGIAIALLGAMGGGKTTTICLLAETLGPDVARVYKHKLDLTRTGKQLVNHSGDVMARAALYESIAEITPLTQTTVIDELQFAGDDQASLASFLDRQRGVGWHTIFGLLDFDFKREAWPLTRAAIELADHVLVIQPRCTNCNERPAEFTQRTVNGRPAHVKDPVTVVGAEELYQAACGFCHEVRGKSQSRYV